MRIKSAGRLESARTASETQQQSTRADHSRSERTGQIPLAWSSRPGPYHRCQGACRKLRTGLPHYGLLRIKIIMRAPKAPPSETCNLRLHHSPQHSVITSSNDFAPQSVGHQNCRWGLQRSYPPRCWPGWVDEVSVPLSPFACIGIHTARGYLDSMENFISGESPAKYHPPAPGGTNRLYRIPRM